LRIGNWNVRFKNGKIRLVIESYWNGLMWRG